MKFNLVMVTALLLTVCTFKLSAGDKSPAVDIPEVASNSQMGWVGSINSKTWVVSSIEDGDQTSHFVVGDAFKIADINAVKRFVPFRALRDRLNATSLSQPSSEDASSEDAFIPLTMLMRERHGPVGPKERQQHFCAKIKFKNHEKIGSPQQHVMQIQIKDSRKLEIHLHEYSDESWNQCTSFSTHGGIVHARS